MRPVYLSIRGLHSFRDAVEIDFDTLCSGGVFGIFGPTGSGKSTILDAMTFALYGKIGRSGATGASMINQAEKEAMVVYTFRLGVRVYTAERRVKRSKDDTLQTTRARFLDVTDEAVVLTDKVGDMNASIEQLLGLKLADFTRAVVLPQNKFSEFLHLKGSDRREMLQRLFNLHKYGDDLNHKIKEGLHHLQGEHRVIDGELQGIGEASEAAVNRAKKEVVEAETTLKKEQEKIEKHKRQWEAAQQLKSLYEELQDAHKEQQSLVEQKPLYEKRQKRLRVHALSKEAKPLLFALEEASADVSVKENEYKKQEESFSQIVKELESAKQQQQQDKEDREKKEPELLVRQAKIADAAEQAKQYEVARKTVKEERENEQQLNKTLKNLSKNKEALSQRITEQKENIEQMQNDLNAYDDRDDERKQVDEAFAQAKSLDALFKSVEEVGEQLIQTKKKQTEIETKARQAINGRQQIEEKLSIAYEYALNWYTTFKDLERQKAKMMDAVKLKGMHHTQASVHQIAQNLEAGNPCPVCGSTSHPNTNTERPSEAEERLQTLYENLNTETPTLISNTQLLEQIASQVRTTVTIDEHREREVQQVEETLYEQKSNENLVAIIEQWLEQIPPKTNTVQKIKARTETLMKEHQEQLRVEQAHQAELNYEQKTVEELTKRRNEKHAEWEAEKYRWEKTYSDWSLTTIAKTREHVHEQASIINRLRKNVQQEQQSLQKLEADHKRLEEDMYKLEIDVLKSQHNRQQAEAQMTSFEKQHRHVVDVDNIEKAKADVEEQIARLKAKVKSSDERVQASTKHYEEVDAKRTTARTRFESAKEFQEKADKDWRHYQQTKSFTTLIDLVQFDTAAQLSEWVLSDEERLKNEEQKDDYERKTTSVTANVERLENRMEGKTFDEEAFAELERSYRESESRVETLKEQRTTARSRWEDVQEKHVRYAKLNKKKEHYEQQISNYKELESVFRGKEFVDFLAEEQLIHVTKNASERLHDLTRGRYALVLDSSGGFLIADYFNGGEKRPTTSLSGGETFLTSLALALSLSASIQLTGEQNLEFFFLDEGFGTLDTELLDTVVTALEQLQTDHLAVGVISHVPELQERLQTRLLVTPATAEGTGSRVTVQS
ncbi:SbcC/MukB-like Walker B domain-containing protein [Geomicrobium sp. JCM 19039]|uniref:SbcC/MukB-like Walker B domain-containing protein n=1 Tax=Geomicrobium sp. JCM 19039 TaxID=1460636 RepID=UPI00045F2710|nr:SMC family ATPase [Geomicrobium sp. JCM 19039]GAK11124.1 exonuclease SbcC [Geomicrobium sp. JCM 19039]